MIARRTILSTLVAVLLLLLSAHGLGAQMAAGADVALQSQNIWRGLTFTNRPVLQPDAFLAYTTGKTTLSAGTWGSIELGRYDGSSDLSQGGGRSALDLTELNWWLEGRYRLTLSDVTFGITGYQYPNPAGMTSADNSVALYARVEAVDPLNPRFALFYDVDAYNGLYGEVGIGHRFAVSGAIGINLNARVGLATGLDPSPGDLSRYDENGITHLDFSASTTIPAAGITWMPIVHLIVASDPRVRITGPGETKHNKILVGLRGSWFHVFRPAGR